jgi:DNA primase small subunit
MLTADFGFSERDVHVFFSGHRGYHIHVENEVVKGLDSNERKEIVDYVSGLGFDGTLHSLVEKDWDFSRALKTLGFNDLGWRGRIAKGLYGFILKAKDEDFDKLGLPKNVVATVIKNRDSILHDWGDKSSRKLAKGVGLETWKKLIEFCARSQAAQIDTVVTTDTHRLIRMPKTLHGKTGLKKAEVPLSEIESYDPFNDAVAFKKGIATVFISSVPEFMLGGQTFGPYENKQVELPTAAAVLLVCKGRAKVVE